MEGGGTGRGRGRGGGEGGGGRQMVNTRVDENVPR